MSTDHAAALYGDGKPAAAASALSHGTLAVATPAARSNDAASMLYGDGKAAAPAAPARQHVSRDAASALYGDGKPAAPVPRDPAAVKLATAMRGGRGVEPEDEPAEPAAPAAPAAKHVEPTGTDEQQQQQQHVEYVPSDEAKSIYASTMRDLISADVNRLGAELGAAEVWATEVAGMFEAFAVNPSDASYIVEVAVAAAANGVPEEKQLAWRRDARDALAAEYPGNVDRAVQLAQRLVARHPSIRTYLAESGLGDSPVVVRAVAAQAWRLAADGRL